MNYTALFLLRSCCIASFLALAMFSLPTQANPLPNQLISVEFSLDNSSTITIGEPLVLRYKITNVSANLGVACPVAVEKEDWYSLDLKDANGVSVAKSKKTETRNLRGFRSENFTTLPQAGSDQDYLVASQLFAIRHAGKYLLTVRVHALCAPVDDTEQNLLSVKQAIKANGSPYTATYTFAVNVSDLSPTRLQSVATSIVQKLSTETDGKETKYLLNALFSMPEAYCLLEWQAVVNKPGMNAALIATKLENIGSVQASNLLFQMLDSPSLSSDDSTFVSEKLAEAYNSGNADLRSHLKNTMTQRGVALPDKVAIPQVAD